MSYPTVPAFIISGYNEESRKNPAMKWLEEYTHDFDAGLQNMGSKLEKYFTPDFTFAKGDGSVHEGLEKAWGAISQTYSVFTTYHHQPSYGVCYEIPEGYNIDGVASFFYNLQGQGASAGVKDAEGKSYDGVLPGAFRFTLVKSGDSFKLKHISTVSDSGPIVVQLLQRGVMTPAQLGL